MTEQEIIIRLKRNRYEGVSYKFLPIEVQDYVWNTPNRIREGLEELNAEGEWVRVNTEKDFVSSNSVFSIYPDYSLPKNGGWVEFSIKDGVFYDAELGICYKWYEWPCFIAKNTSYEAFGGWQYEGDSGWFMAPCLTKGDKQYCNYMVDENCKPAIPIKIRFWKEKYDGMAVFI